MKSFPSYWRIALRGIALGIVAVLILVATVTLATMALDALFPAPLPRLGGDKSTVIIELAVFIGGLLALTYGGGIGFLASSLMWLFFRYMPREWTRHTGWSGALCGLVAVALVAIPQGIQNIIERKRLDALLPNRLPTNEWAMSVEYVVLWLFPAILVAGVGAWAALRYFSDLKIEDEPVSHSSNGGVNASQTEEF